MKKKSNKKPDFGTGLTFLGLTAGIGAMMLNLMGDIMFGDTKKEEHTGENVRAMAHGMMKGIFEFFDEKIAGLECNIDDLEEENEKLGKDLGDKTENYERIKEQLTYREEEVRELNRKLNEKKK